MATSGVDGLEKMESEGEKAPLLESGASQLSVSTRRRVCLERSFSLITILCAVLFPLLGASILGLGALISQDAGGAYVGGGTAELVLGVCLVLRLAYQLLRLPRRTPGDTANCVLFAVLTFCFMVWCAVVCTLCAALVLNGLNYERNWRETAAMTLSSLSLVLMLVFGGSVCCWAGCPAD